MLDTVIRSPSRLDPATHADCLELIRAAIASNHRQTALDIKNVLAEVCASGYADRAQIWADLTPTEQQQFQELLGPPPIARDASPENPRGDRLQFPGGGWRDSN